MFSVFSEHLLPVSEKGGSTCEESSLPECPGGSERVPERNNHPVERGEASLIWLGFLDGTRTRPAEGGRLF